mgnify:FL=1
MLRWIDTHNHLFVLSEEQQKKEVWEARRLGVVSSLVCAGGVDNLEDARRCAYEQDQAYACGIHPLYIRSSWKEDLTALEAFLEEHQDDPRLAAVGECGLDFSAACSVPHDVQEEVFSAQLKFARKYGLPLSLHGREAMDIVLKYIRRLPPQLGIIHAFNGSMAQAQAFLQNGFKLGYGGAMTYDGSKRIRKILSELPDDAWVLETDCPDMPPSWVREQNQENPESALADTARYGARAAELRNTPVKKISEQSIQNTLKAIPKFRVLISASRDEKSPFVS